jgi:hypothetical protein
VSCPAVSLCVATDFGGQILTSTNPSGGASEWPTMSHSAPSFSVGGTVPSVACGSVSLCVQPAGGAAFVSTDPRTKGSWTPTNIDQSDGGGNGSGPGGVTAVSCVSTRFCVAVDADGNAVVGAPATRGQVRSLLRKQLRRSRRHIRIIPLLVAGGYRTRIKALCAGRLRISWTATGTGSHGEQDRMLIASGQTRFTAADARTLTIRLTRRGKYVLRHVRSLRLIVSWSFKPLETAAIAVRGTLKLRR